MSVHPQVPSHVVVTRPHRNPDVVVGKVYEVADAEAGGGSVHVVGGPALWFLLGPRDFRPATPEEVALGHCSHVVSALTGGVFPCLGCNTDGSAEARHRRLPAGQWRPATLEEMGL